MRTSFPSLSSFRALSYLLVLAMGASATSCASLEKSGVPEGMRRREARAILHKYEEPMGMRLKMKRDFRLFYMLDGWMGVPYAYGKCSKAGTDCSGFTQRLYQEYYFQTIPRSSAAQMEDSRRIRRTRRLRRGHLVFFSFESGKKVSHVGFYLDNGRFVHASSSKGVRIDRLSQEYYSKGFVGGGKPRKRGLTENATR